MNTDTPLISFFMPVWNGSAYLADSIGSILRQQLPVEIVVADDGSTDGSAELAASLGCRVLRLEHGGIARACNAAIREAHGAYLMMLDQDDILCDGALAVMLSALQEDAALDAVAARAQDFLSPELDAAARAALRVRPEPYYGLMTGALLMRADVPARIGGFNEAYKAGQAVDFLLRMEKAGIACRKLELTSVMRRLHASNTSRTMKARQFNDYGAMLRARLKGESHA